MLDYSFIVTLLKIKINKIDAGIPFHSGFDKNQDIAKLPFHSCFVKNQKHQDIAKLPFHSNFDKNKNQ